MRAALCLALLAGCSAEMVDACSSEADCPPGLICLGNTCLQTCNSDGECPTGTQCDSGVCRPGVPTGGDSDRGDDSAPGGDAMPAGDSAPGGDAAPPGDATLCTPTLWHRDADGDGFTGSATQSACEAPGPDWLASAAPDCDDTNSAMHPGAVERCVDLVDNDCDGDFDHADAACALQMPPLAAFSITPPAGAAGVEVLFDAAATTDDTDALQALELTWDVGDDGTNEGSGVQLQLTFTSPGLHRVLLRATDTHGLTGKAVGWVAVAADAASLLVVTTPADNTAADGEVSIREAIAAARASAGADVITFAGPMVITVGSHVLVNADDTIMAGRAGVRLETASAATSDCIYSLGTRVSFIGLDVGPCGDDAFDIEGQDTFVGGCTIHEARDDGIQASVLPGHHFAHNVVHSCGSDGVQIASLDSLVAHNQVFGNNHGISVSNEASGSDLLGNFVFDNRTQGIIVGEGAESLMIIHNTSHGNGNDGLRFLYPIVQPAGGHVVRNNIFSGNSDWGIDNGGNGAELAMTVTHNIYFGNASGACSTCPGESAASFTDPRFVGMPDLRLRLTSPAIDSATGLGIDRNGSAPGLFDGSAPDRGAYEAR